MNEFVLVSIRQHQIKEWGVISNGMFYYLGQYFDSIIEGKPIERLYCGFIYFDILMKLRVKK